MVLTLPITQPVYYFAQKNGESQRVEGTEKNRHDLLQAVADGAVRKVLVKYDVSLVEEGSLEDILEQLQEALVALEPYYLANPSGVERFSPTCICNNFAIAIDK